MPNKQTTTNKKEILLIEDEDQIRNLYVKLLTEAGFKLDIANDGKEGFKKIKEGGYKLVLLDIMLPEIDGFDILERLQRRVFPQQTLDSIVLLTNLNQDQTIEKAKSYGIKGYMVKSDYNPEEFIRKVKAYLSV